MARTKKLNLVILESPWKAGTVQGYLGAGYHVLACDGHVRDLPKSTLGVDIENGFEPKYINIRGKGDLIRSLKKAVKAADCVYLATDPDREGEAISWHLVTALEIPAEKVRRITFNEVTKGAVKEAIKNPRAIDMDLVNSQQARRILDRVVGYKLSPFLWKTVRSGLSAGRVQSAATRAIVDREDEIRAFVPEEYQTIDVMLDDGSGKPFRVHYYNENEEREKNRIYGKEAAEAVVRSINENAKVCSVKKAVRYKTPQPPFITSTLQQEANRHLNFQSSRTMRVAQELYEGVDLGSENGGTNGLISYMRTDSLRISEEAAASAAAYIREKFGDKYCPEKPREYKSRNTAQDAHEAIRPSNMKFEPDRIKKHLSADQYKLYRLIWNRFVASQMESAVLDTVNAEFSSGGAEMRCSGYTVRFKGYMALLDDSDDGDDGTKGLRLPELAEGQMLRVTDVDAKTHVTEPPARFTEATLVRFFEETGIARPSTYATIITTILSRGYVAREGKALKPTNLGEVTNRLMIEYFPKITDYDFTASMEEQLDDIASGGETVLHVLSDFYDDFEKSLEVAEEKAECETIEVEPEKTDIICDKCGAVMVVKNGRFGKFAACPNYPECKNTKPLTEKKPERPEQDLPSPAGMKCELCGADMVIRPGKYGSFYACSRYPECKFTKQANRPIGIRCPKCGGEIVQKRGRNRMVFYACDNYPTCDFSSWDLPIDEKCPKCGSMLFRKKGKNYIFCHEKGCDYRRDCEPEPTDKKEEADTAAE